MKLNLKKSEKVRKTKEKLKQLKQDRKLKFECFLNILSFF